MIWWKAILISLGIFAAFGGVLGYAHLVAHFMVDGPKWAGIILIVLVGLIFFALYVLLLMRIII